MDVTTTDKTSLKIKDFRNDHDYIFLLAFYIVDKLRWNWTDRSAVQLNIENERFTVACSSCRSSLKSENFALLFGRLRQRILLMCVMQVQHDYFPHLSNQRVAFCRCCCHCRCCLRCSNSLIYSLVAVVIMVMTIYNDNGDVVVYLNLKYLGKLKIELC